MSYSEGFTTKCKEAGVDPRRLLKAAARGDLLKLIAKNPANKALFAKNRPKIVEGLRGHDYNQLQQELQQALAPAARRTDRGMLSDVLSQQWAKTLREIRSLGRPTQEI
jgi:hypothetical protein